MSNMKELLKAAADKLNISVEELTALSKAEIKKDKQRQLDLETKYSSDNEVSEEK